MQNFSTKIISVAFFLSFSSVSYAGTPEALKTADDGTGFIGAVVLSSAEYSGSDQQDITILPYLSLKNVKGFDLRASTLSYRLFEAGTGQGMGKWSLRAGPTIGYQDGRDSDDSPTLTGLEDVDFSIPVGGQIRSTFGPLGVQLNLAKDIAGGHDGITGDVSIGTLYRNGKFAIQPFAAAHWGNNDYHDSFFGISAEQSAASGLAAFEADSGLYAYSANVVTWVEFGEHNTYAVTLLGSYKKFTGDADDSPILNAVDGIDNEVTVALAFARKFDTTKW